MVAAVSEDEVRAAWALPYPPSPYDIWTRTNVGEVLPGAVTPLTWAIYREIGEAVFIRQPERIKLIPRELMEDGLPPLFFRAINGRLYYNAGLLHHMATAQLGLPTWFYSLSIGGPQEGERLGLPATGIKPARLLRMAPVLLREQRRLEASVRDFERSARAMRAEVARLRADDLAGLDAPALVRRLERVTARAGASYGQLFEGSIAALNAYGLLALLCERWLGDRTLANDLVTGLSSLLTAQASTSLWQVAEAAGRSPGARRLIEVTPPADLRGRLAAETEAQAVAAALDRFFLTHGHRSADEFELSKPRWVEDPTFVVSTLRAYLSAPAEADPRGHLRRQRARRRAAEREARERLTATPIGKLLPWRWLIFRRALRDARRLLPMRENPKHHFLLYAAELRRTALALGERLTAAGSIERPDDVFYLGRGELTRVGRRSAGDLRALVAARRALVDRYAGWTPPEVVPGAEVASVEAAFLASDDGEPAAPLPSATAVEPPAAGSLKGIAASAGVVSGRARVALTPDEGAEIEPGEILVAPFTDPGWTPLFTVAGGIVMDLGGLLSHGAIVAREYGIPAVVNTRTATTMVQTGQLVTVDGNTGEVRWEKDE